MALGARRVIAQYRNPGLRASAYMHVRWAVCPFDRILPFVPEEGEIVDVGCGSGLWLNYLALERPNLRLHGIDPDPRKIEVANASKTRHIDFRRGTADDLPAGAYDCVTILDVLCEMPAPVKAGALRAIHGALRPGGTIVVKDADTSPWWKYAPTALQEQIAVHVMRITHGRPHFWSLDELARGVSAAGFRDVETARIDRGYLHPHVVVCARKAGL
jgi:2-polyprenyl-3-methyl-5-hydroxy-6-metoxy-1,4-benzoquinol methylase